MSWLSHILMGEARISDLVALARVDAPLTKHEDARRLYKVLCNYVRHLGHVLGDEDGRCANWEGATRTVAHKLTQEDMSENIGGVGRARWRAYVWCVVKALFVWQAYCQRARDLMYKRVEQMGGEAESTEEGVWAYRMS